MRKSLPLLAIFTAAMLLAHAQITDPKQTAQQGATDKANNNVSNSVNIGLDKTENAIKGLFKKKKKDATPAGAGATTNTQAGATAGTANGNTGAASLKTYANYDFVPGEKIVFEDNFTEDQDGEFPDRAMAIDQYRVLVMPDCGGCKLSSLDMGGIGDAEHPIVFRNFRLAEGGNMNMTGKKFTDARIVTHGINFDVDKSIIKPESMGTLNMIMQILNGNPGIKFEIDGHTDNTGAAAHNLQLSQQRADAVRTQLVAMGRRSAVGAIRHEEAVTVRQKTPNGMLPTEGP